MSRRKPKAAPPLLRLVQCPACGRIMHVPAAYRGDTHFCGDCSRTLISIRGVDESPKP
jgi:hypothetical protein